MLTLSVFIFYSSIRNVVNFKLYNFKCLLNSWTSILSALLELFNFVGFLLKIIYFIMFSRIRKLIKNGLQSKFYQFLTVKMTVKLFFFFIENSINSYLFKKCVVQNFTNFHI